MPFGAYLLTNLRRNKMYAKIQKDMSCNYILIESNDIELSFSTIKTNYENYVRNILPCLIAYNEEENIRNKVYEHLQTIFNCTDWLNVKPATNLCLYDCKENNIELNCNCDVKGIKVDGTYYVTCGNIYIMNDKGQTIQKI